VNKKIKILFALLLLALPLLGQTETDWALQQSTLTYHISHPLHQVDGVSHAARGKGVCHGGQCDFLIAVPVKSFDSGDSNRDLHMLQVTRGGEFPMVTVRTQLPESAAASATLHADLEVSFAGQTVTYKQVPFQLSTQGNEAHLSGTIPATLSDFKIEPPSLLTIPVKNDIPVRVEMTWQKQK
jgi:YceI-like domain